jgi:hypothetical protein
LRIGVDIGGTFTDLVAVQNDNTLVNSKALSTPEDQSIGIMDCLLKTDLNLADTELFLHGSTVAINTVIERKGAKTALITTRGFRDVYEIGRCNRTESYNLDFHRPKPLIPRHRRFEITERLNYLGEILMWWGVYIIMLSSSPRMWFLGAGALVNTFMFLFVSIPLADKRNRKLRPGFAEYARETRRLLPFKKAIRH